MKVLTLVRLEKYRACKKAIDEFKKSKETNLLKIFDILIKSNEKEKLQWSNWLIVRIMNKKQRIQYAIFAAELVINIFEEKHPKDKRPREAIEATKKYLKHPSIKNRTVAIIAYDAAACSATVAADTYIAYTVADIAADAAAYTAYTTVTTITAYAAANAAANATINYDKTLATILKNGFEIVKKITNE